ncbi:MAG: 4-hydroxythreonine-4-phosphate dehydrogenase PdxA [Candidatus Binatia bacterium]
MAKPRVAITMGDPSGVGPEVVIKALAAARVLKSCHPIVVGDWNVLQRALPPGKPKPYRFVPWQPGEPLPQTTSQVPVYSLSQLSQSHTAPGHPSVACGKATYCYIRSATELILSGSADAMATAPISKRVLHLAGYRYPGHTELLAQLTQTAQCRMMLIGGRLKITLVTVHVPYRRVPRELTRPGILVTLGLTHRALQDYFGCNRPRIAVAALNPHAGEEGIFGPEEKETIAPAVRDARRRGIQADGPYPADSIFFQAARGDFDAVICMYHDQGLIPLKLLSFFGGVTLTLGLPFVRTSVDHGTAYDIAGKNMADASSMREAILLAGKLCRPAQH